MKNSTLNGDLAVATAAFAQFYESFAWDNDTALTAFDYGIEQTFFENLEAELGRIRRACVCFIKPSDVERWHSDHHAKHRCDPVCRRYAADRANHKPKRPE